MPKSPFTSHGRQSTLRTPVGARDARTGLGYGLLNPKVQVPRQLGSSFPYYEKDELDPEDEEIDQETADAVRKKYSKYQPSDFSRAAGSEPFYFVGGNTKLSDCFWNAGAVLNEIAAFANSMAPIPHQTLYPGAQAGLSGGPFLPGKGKAGGNFQQTGDVRGWSHAPAPISKFEEISDDNFDWCQEEDEPIFTLRDLAKKQSEKNGENFANTNI
jgi:hypothetical protein